MKASPLSLSNAHTDRQLSSNVGTRSAIMQTAPIKTQGTCLIGTLLCRDWDRGHFEIFNAFILIQGLHFADDIQGFSYILNKIKW